MTNGVYKVLHSIMGSLEVSSLNSLHATQCGNVSGATKADEGHLEQGQGQRAGGVSWQLHLIASPDAISQKPNNNSNLT